MFKLDTNKVHSVEEFQKVLFDFFIFISDEFEKRWDIKLWAHSGTLLGYIRHNGFIPWDDDIDVAGSYEKIEENYDEIINFLKENDLYSYDPYTHDNDEGMHIITKEKIKIKRDEDILETNIFIDIMLTYPTSYSGKKISTLSRARGYQWGLEALWMNKLLWIFLPFMYLSVFLIHLFLINKIIKKIMWRGIKKKRTNDGKEQMIYDFSSRNIFVKELKQIKIWGHDVYIPSNYEEVLEKSYGKDWQTPPVNLKMLGHLRSNRWIFKYWIKKSS